MGLKFCSCKYCRAGRRSVRNKAIITRANRRLRHDAKVALRLGRQVVNVVSVPYTD